jgi:3-oxoacyl-(acyl-carrier-protein) synthase
MTAQPGGAEAIFTILALRDQVARPTLNLDNGDAASQGDRRHGLNALNGGV